MPIFKRQFFVRSIEAGKLLDSFLIAAIASLLTIRFYLSVADYPRVGIGPLHIAHMLWGGLLMLAAIVGLLAFLSRPVKHSAAIVGGIGFGLFIDELGKFITRDNDYFFQPTIALLYVIFILLYLLFRRIQQDQMLTREELLANTLDIIKEAVFNDFSREERAVALQLLEKAGEEDQVTKSLSAIIRHSKLIATPKPGIYSNLRKSVALSLRSLLLLRFFIPAIVLALVFGAVYRIFRIFSVVHGGVELAAAAAAGTLAVYGLLHSNARGARRLVKLVYLGALVALSGFFTEALSDLVLPYLSISEWGELLSSAVSAGFVMVGFLALRSDRLFSYRQFERALMISIFLTQFFTFYRDQMGALAGLAVNILLLLAMRSVIKQSEKDGNG